MTDLLTQSQAIEKINSDYGLPLSNGSFYRLIRIQKLPYVLVSPRKRLFDSEAIDKWFSRRDEFKTRENLNQFKNSQKQRALRKQQKVLETPAETNEPPDLDLIGEHTAENSPVANL
ncbi:MAG: hypothetical protein LBP29_07555 [Treponema sp.]|jgi:hypothetical protein|nr:hypothetical protein [Treponema sp.]